MLWGKRRNPSGSPQRIRFGEIEHEKKIEQYEYVAYFDCNGKALEDF